MGRITIEDLEGLVSLLNRRTDQELDYDLCWAYGGVRLVRKGGSVDVLPRTSKPEQYRLIAAYIEGLSQGLSRLELHRGS